MNELQTLRDILPLLLPILVIQTGLIIAALWDLAHRSKTRGPKWAWVVVILFLNLLGPIIYLVAGREDE